MTPDERVKLLGIARRSLRDYLLGPDGDSSPPPLPPALPPALEEALGAFVSVYVGDELRGCMGRIDSPLPLHQSVAELVRSAALHDYRFAPVRADELPRVRLEISTLGKMQRITPEEVCVGRHGLHISQGKARGLLLPQVAPKYGWDRERFLAETCVKAGLEPTAWREPDTVLEGFTAEVFGDPPTRSAS
jgi:AmmeMemoRadiSam system protein A